MLNLPGGISIRFPSLASLDPEAVQVILTAGIIFITAVLIGLSRRYFTKSTLQGIWAGFVVGIMSVLILEGVIFWGIKGFVSSERAQILPENVRIALTDSQDKITQVLGIQTERQRPSAQTVASDYEILTPLDADLVRNSICSPRLQEAGQAEE